jgi:predicted alpha/beta superfamily hydrolase
MAPGPAGGSSKVAPGWTGGGVEPRRHKRVSALAGVSMARENSLTESRAILSAASILLPPPMPMTERHIFRTVLLLWLAVGLVLGGSATAQVPSTRAARLLFDVTVPPETPADASVSLVGTHPALGGGAEPGLVLRHQGGGHFTGTVDVPPGQELSYRILLTGAGRQVELDESGAVVAARKLASRSSRTVRLSVARWGPEAGQPVPQVTFLVQVPASTPAEATLWLAGNHAELGQWKGQGLKLTRALEGRHAASLTLPAGTALEYKVTRGSWESVEKGTSGEELPNRTFRMGSRSERVSLTVSRWADTSPVPPPSATLTGNVRHLRNVASRHLPRARDIIVWLPPDYDANPTRRYPVLYMHDGQNLMDASTSFSGEWHVDETAQRLVRAGQVEPLIIVGVYNTEDRFSEYTQVVDPEYPQYGGGKADAYGRFLVEELKPLIDKTFRTRTKPQDTGLAGSSLGGLVTMHLGIAHSNVFRRLGVISPSVFWGGKDIVSRVKGLRRKQPLRIWVDIGTEEWRGSQETVEDARLLRDALRAKGWVPGKDLRYVEVPGAVHTESAWAERFGDTLKYLYPPQP